MFVIFCFLFILAIGYLTEGILEIPKSDLFEFKLAKMASKIAASSGNQYILSISIQSLVESELMERDIIDEVMSQIGAQIPIEYVLTSQLKPKHRRLNNLIIIDGVDSFQKVINQEGRFYSASGHFTLILPKYHADIHLKVLQEIFNICWRFDIVNVNIVTMNAVDHTIPAIYTYRPFSQQICIDTTPVNIYKTLDMVSSLFPDKTKNMHGCPVSIGIVHIPPTIFVNVAKDNTMTVHGVEGELIQLLAARLNFTPVLSIPKDNLNWGSVTIVDGKLKNVTGVLGMAYNREVNISFGGVGMRHDRYLVLDITPMYHQSVIDFIQPLGRPYTAFEKLFLPFELPVWAILATGCVLYFIFLISWKYIQQQNMNVIRFAQNTLPALEDSTRFLTIISLLAYIVLANSYTSALFHFIRRGRNHSAFDTIDELIDAGLEFKTLSSTGWLLNVPHIYSRTTVFYGNASDLVAALRQPNVKFTVLASVETINYENSVNYTQGILKVTKGSGLKLNLCAYLPKNSYFTKSVSSQIELFLSYGWINLWLHKFAPLVDKSADKFNIPVPTVLHYSDINGCVYVCLVLCVMSSVVLALEFLTQYSTRLKCFIDFLTY